MRVLALDDIAALVGVRVEADGPEGVVVLLDGVDLTLTAPRVAVIGENGSGKSTLLTALAGLSDPASGALEVLGEDPRRRSQRTSFVMQ
ncbi:ATP-binding cassette domain-containing protein, partial [Staphylococcus lugdunensis]|uniref:ATP-binding cassette domain-containing protein n=1 Tax=Staphylococcus lugdunensis TaxID=28035 RepID=UPI0025534CF9